MITTLPTDLVVRYRAVDREEIVAPPYVVDTPAHLDALTESIRERGIEVPLKLEFNERLAFLDGNHRIAVALRLGLAEVPVELVRAADDDDRAHGRALRPEDRSVLEAAMLGD